MPKSKASASKPAQLGGQSFTEKKGPITSSTATPPSAKTDNGKERYEHCDSARHDKKPCDTITVHLGYNDVSIPQSRIAISKLSLYPERFTDGTGIIDSKGPNRNKEDIVISRIVITRVDSS